MKVQQSVDLVLGEVRLLQQDLHLLLVVLVGLAGGGVADGHSTRHHLSRIFYINTLWKSSFFPCSFEGRCYKDHRMDVLKLLLSIWFIQGRE